MSTREAMERAYHAMSTLEMLIEIFEHLDRERADDDQKFEEWCGQMALRCRKERGRRFEIYSRAREAEEGHEPTRRVLEEISLERDRQWCVEGYTTEHDDGHVHGELSTAAGCYALGAGHQLNGERPLSIDAAIDLGFPWGSPHWKPKGVRRDLIRAAALIVAEIERLDRMAATNGATE